MTEKNIEKTKEDWFKKLDFPLKSINNQYKKLIFKNKEISKDQRILNEYNIRNISNKKYKIKNNSLAVNEKLLLKRINVYNYKNIEGENNIMKNIITKIKERNNKNRNMKNIYLKLKRFNTNNNYENLKLNYSPINNKNNKSTNQNIKNLNIKNINNSLLDTPSITDRKIINKSLKFISDKKLYINLDNINSEKIEEKSKNFFKTLTRIEKYNVNENKFKKKLENLGDIMRIIKDEEDYGNLINKNILYIKKNKKNLNTINQNRNSYKKLNLSLNYSNIKSIKDIKNKITNNLNNNIYKNLNKNLYKKDLNNNKETNKINNNIIIKEKNCIILPICPNTHKG